MVIELDGFEELSLLMQLRSRVFVNVKARFMGELEKMVLRERRRQDLQADLFLVNVILLSRSCGRALCSPRLVSSTRKPRQRIRQLFSRANRLH